MATSDPAFRKLGSANGKLGRRLDPKSARPLLIFCAVAVLYVLRRPDIVLNPQFWAEDGTLWYADAYRQGWRSLLVSHTGYLQSFSRATMLLAQQVPLAFAPLLANGVGLAVRALIPAFLFSSRFAWIPHRGKWLMLAYYILMPGLAELHANITNTETYLAIYLFLVVITASPPSKWWRLHDLSVLILAGSTGPFVALIAPCYGIRLLVELSESRVPLRGLARTLARPFPVAFAGLVLLQGLCFLTAPAGARATAPLGASPLLLAQILVSRIFAGFLVEPGTMSAQLCQAWIAVPLFCLSVGILAVVAWHGGWRVRCVVLFAASVMATALAGPQMSLTMPQWPGFLLSGERYFVIPNLCWMGVLVRFFAISLPRLRHALWAVGLAAVAVSGIYDFRIPPLPDLGFAAQARRFEDSSPGETMRFAIPPPGWAMNLTKK